MTIPANINPNNLTQMTVLWSHTYEMFNPKLADLQYFDVKWELPKTKGFDGHDFWIECQCTGKGNLHYSHNTTFPIDGCKVFLLLKIFKSDGSYHSTFGDYSTITFYRDRLRVDDDIVYMEFKLYSVDGHFNRKELDQPPSCFVFDHSSFLKAVTLTPKNDGLHLKLKDGEMQLTGKTALVKHFAYFQAMFQHDFIEASTNTVKLSDISMNTFKVFWGFALDGKLDDLKDLESFTEVYEFARMIQFPAMQAACVKWLIEHPEVKISNLQDALLLALDQDQEIDRAVQKVVFDRLKKLYDEEHVSRIQGLSI
jgi:hypothetical protein